jgi:hypothetical protein
MTAPADNYKHWCTEEAGWHDGRRADCTNDVCTPAREAGVPDEWKNGALVTEYGDSSAEGIEAARSGVEKGEPVDGSTVQTREGADSAAAQTREGTDG